MAGAVLAPVYREFEVAPTKLRFARVDTATPAPWMVARVDTLSNIARLVLGESEVARDAVEDALSKVRRVNRRIPRDDREVMKLKTLVASLDRADQKRSLAGMVEIGNKRPGNLIDILQGLDFSTRIAFALRSEFPLKEVAEILGHPEADVAEQVARARLVVSAETTGGGT